MNAREETERLLEESGAVLIRQSRHLVYRLPNGKIFVAAKTPSDPVRAAKNNLSDLRRALGGPRLVARQEPIVMELPQEISPRDEQERAPGPPDRAGEGDTLHARIEAMIESEEAAQDLLLAEAQGIERRVHLLRALMPFADDPATEAALRALAPPAPIPPPMPAAEPPQQIGERVQVTRQLVFAATQTFAEPFTINDVVALMTGARQIAADERRRIRSSIAQCVISLYERAK